MNGIQFKKFLGKNNLTAASFAKKTKINVATVRGWMFRGLPITFTPNIKKFSVLVIKLGLRIKLPLAGKTLVTAKGKKGSFANIKKSANRRTATTVS